MIKAVTDLPLTEDWLKINRWEKELFFYAIGGDEDESDMTIWVKNGIAITNEYGKGFWHRANYDNLNYIEGFPDNDIVTDIRELETINR